MFGLDKAMSDLYSASEAMQNYASDAVVQETYRAALEIYSRKLQIQKELAQEFMKSNRNINEKIFNDAIRYLDAAIDNSNSELAESALKLIKVMKEREPEFFSEYYKMRFGR